MVFTFNCEKLHSVGRINRSYEVYAPGVKLSREKAPPKSKTCAKLKFLAPTRRKTHPISNKLPNLATLAIIAISQPTSVYLVFDWVTMF